MKFKMKFKALFAFILILGLVLPVAAVSANEVEGTEEGVNYLALGDSLAAGINDKGELAKGYADHLAKIFHEEGVLKNYNKGFAVPRYKTTDILNDLKNNVTKPIFNLEGLKNQTVDLQTAVKEADIITISVGANDILPLIKKDSETGQLNYDLQQVMAGIKTVGENYYEILKGLKKINPDAEIFVMGYYNPYPTLEAYKQPLSLLVNSLDEAVSEATDAMGGHFVEVEEVVAANYSKYIPNPENIHLSDEGYKVVGFKFLETLAALSDEQETSDEPSEVPSKEILFSDITGHWSAEYVQAAVELGIMMGYGDGTFKPNQALTRIQMISIIARSIDVPEQAVDVPFVDISNYPKETQAEVAKAVGLGLVKGSNGYLKPQDNVTRAELALMISRTYLAVTGESYVPKKVAPFTDIASYDIETQNAITLLYDFDIVKGTGNNAFSPSNNVTRGQAAKIVIGFLQYFEN